MSASVVPLLCSIRPWMFCPTGLVSLRALQPTGRVTDLFQYLGEGSSVYINELLPLVSFGDMSTQEPITSSLFRSMLNCFRPSSRATYLEDDLETDCGCCCITFFLSRSVLRRRRS